MQDKSNKPKTYMIIDGLWGSCGKGALAGYLAMGRNPDLAVCNFGPNAGHTYITKEGRTILTRQLPSAIVNTKTEILIGPGAIIDVEWLLKELEEFGDLNVSDRLSIHPHAALVHPEDREKEKKTMGAIASTQKGTGVGIMRKISRPVNQMPPAVAKQDHRLIEWVISQSEYNNMVDNAKIIQIESAQGVDLSINHGVEYPYTTSRDITPEAVMNDCAVPMRYLLEVCAVFRTFPIRVGNIVEDGVQIGHSGGCYKDQMEISWDDVGRITGQELLEHTTVTGRVRRVFTFSWEQFRKSTRILGPCSIFLNFANYLPPKKVNDMVMTMEKEASCGASVNWIGWGPNNNDIAYMGKN